MGGGGGGGVDIFFWRWDIEMLSMVSNKLIILIKKLTIVSIWTASLSIKDLSDRGGFISNLII